MKRIFVLRHAKSDWNAPFGDDHERPLNPRGVDAARQVGRFLANLGQVPDGVITSTAVRARTTVELAAEAGSWSCPAQRTRELYESSPEATLDVVRQADDAWTSLLLAGHEPTWSRLVGRLAGGIGGCAEIKMVTGALARIDIDAMHWAEVDFGRGTLAWLVAPKLLTSLETSRDDLGIS